MIQRKNKSYKTGNHHLLHFTHKYRVHVFIVLLCLFRFYHPGTSYANDERYLFTAFSADPGIERAMRNLKFLSCEWDKGKSKQDSIRPSVDWAHPDNPMERDLFNIYRFTYEVGHINEMKISFRNEAKSIGKRITIWYWVDQDFDEDLKKQGINFQMEDTVEITLKHPTQNNLKSCEFIGECFQPKVQSDHGSGCFFIPLPEWNKQDEKAPFTIYYLVVASKNETISLEDQINEPESSYLEVKLANFDAQIMPMKIQLNGWEKSGDTFRTECVLPAFSNSLDDEEYSWDLYVDGSKCIGEGKHHFSFSSSSSNLILEEDIIYSFEEIPPAPDRLNDIVKQKTEEPHVETIEAPIEYGTIIIISDSTVMRRKKWFWLSLQATFQLLSKDSTEGNFAIAIGCAKEMEPHIILPPYEPGESPVQELNKAKNITGGLGLNSTVQDAFYILGSIPGIVKETNFDKPNVVLMIGTEWSYGGHAYTDDLDLSKEKLTDTINSLTIVHFSTSADDINNDFYDGLNEYIEPLKEKAELKELYFRYGKNKDKDQENKLVRRISNILLAKTHSKEKYQKDKRDYRK